MYLSRHHFSFPVDTSGCHSFWILDAIGTWSVDVGGNNFLFEVEDSGWKKAPANIFVSENASFVTLSLTSSKDYDYGTWKYESREFSQVTLLPCLSGLSPPQGSEIFTCSYSAISFITRVFCWPLIYMTCSHMLSYMT